MVLIGVRFLNLNGLIYVDIYVNIPRYSGTLTEHAWQLVRKKTPYAVGYLGLPPQIAVNREWRYIGR